MPPPATEARACEELGKGVAAALAVEKPPGEMKTEKLEEEIREEWKEAEGEEQQEQFVDHGYGPNPFE